ncbi:glycosyltransferase [Streptomyces noursei]|uniref:glycosyltransferase n=1 Tax=Streptomyces noursei TaxID=1971 RepID=UPI00344C6729
MRIVFLGNFANYWNSESYYALTLESLGHEVRRFHDDAVSTLELQQAARDCHLFIWLHWPGTPCGENPSVPEILDDVRERGVPVVAYHSDLFHGLPRGAVLKQDQAYRSLTHFFGADPETAAWFEREEGTVGRHLSSGVFLGDCEMLPRTVVDGGGWARDVVFVGCRAYHEEWPYRPQLIDWLSETYGDRFTHVGHDGTGLRYGQELNQLLADAKVVVGDSLCLGYDSPGYWSDRVYELIGRGAFLIHPHVPGLERHFRDGEHLRFYEYGNFAQLRSLIDEFLENDEERETIRRAGFEHVREHHTYTNRWTEMLRVMFGDDDA